MGKMGERKPETMSQEESYDAASHYRYLHLPEEELARLPPDKLLQATLEARHLIDLLIGVLHTPDTSLILRAVTIDLLYTEAERRSREPGKGESTPVTYAIKEVSERLGIRPAAVRQAYEQLDALDGVEIVARQFPQRRRTQMRLPLDETSGGSDGDEEMPE